MLRECATRVPIIDIYYKREMKESNGCMKKDKVPRSRRARSVAVGYTHEEKDAYNTLINDHISTQKPPTKNEVRSIIAL
jgi:hypothetical protein